MCPERKPCVFTDASLGDDDAVGGIGMVAYHIVEGDIVSKFFFSEIVPSWLMEIWQANTPKIIATLELAAAFLALKILSVDFRDIRAFYLLTMKQPELH